MAQSDINALREWGNANGFPVAERGRPSKAAVDAFNAEHPRAKYSPNVVQTMEHAAKPAEGGRTVKMQISVPAVRAWAQENGVKVGERGRLTDEVKDQYVLAQAAARKAERAAKAQESTGE